jgi:hypothetical protein
MDAAGFDYLLRLASLAVAFVGFATIVVTLRRAFGGELSAFHVLLVRIYVEIGLLVAAGALLPSLLGLFGLDSTLIWQFSSALAGIIAPVALIVYVGRSRRVQSGPVKPRVYVRYFISALAVLGLWLNVTGLRNPPEPGPYAAAMTWFLFSAGLIFVQTLDEVLYDKR